MSVKTQRLLVEIDFEEQDLLDEENPTDPQELAKGARQSVANLFAEDGDIVDSYFHDEGLPSPKSIRLKLPISGESSICLAEASRKALKLLRGELATVLQCNCLLGEDLEPIRETLEEAASGDVAELEECIGSLEAALEVNDAG